MVTKPSGGSSAQSLDYELKVSARAKRVTLRVLAGRGLVVTIPSRFARRDVPPLIEKNRQWALNTLAELESRIPRAHRQWPPQRLNLKALGRIVEIGFQSTPRSGRIRAHWQSSALLMVEGCADERAVVAKVIASCLKQEAEAVILSQLSYLSMRHSLSYRKAVIRGQRSVWGSFSSSGTLSLNYKLLFLPPELVEYVILHELTHTQHLDHSAHFWHLLERLAPGARVLDRQLARASVDVPPWLEAGR